MKATTIILAATLALAACGDPDEAPSATAPPSDGGTSSTIADGSGPDPTGSWVLVAGPVDPIPGWDVTVTIDGGLVTGTAACNGYGGDVTWGDGEIAIDGIGMTEMGCEAPVQALEQAFLSSLVAVEAYDVDGDRLELVAPDGTWTFDRLPEVPTAELVGTTWVVDGYLDGDAVSNEPGMDHAFVELSADGTVVGATNCRQLSGTWIDVGGEILFDSFGADGECPPEGGDLDGRIIGVLGDGFRPAIDGDRLTVTSQGGVGLTFRAGDRPPPPAPPSDDAAPDPAGGVDGAVAYIAETSVGEEALLEASVDLDGECLYADDGAGGRTLLLWPFGTTWQADPPAVVSPSGVELPIGGRISAGGGFHDPDDVGRFTDSPAVAAYVEGCGAGGPDGVYVVQHDEFVAVAP